ncbi:hypothetical protein MKW92_036253 [Papaver armeniacum]|nr:hypothetical protein MKW92_036253 [Papaver armeniacum]
MDINLNTEPEPEPELEISPEREREDDRIKPLWLGRRRSRRQTDEIKQMEGNTSSGPMHVDHQQHPQTLHQQHTSHNLQGSMVDPPICENFPMSVGNMHESEQPMGLMNYNKGDKGKICTSQDDKPSFSGSSCQRIKWTDEMAKLLINVVSCTGRGKKICHFAEREVESCFTGYV